MYLHTKNYAEFVTEEVLSLSPRRLKFSLFYRFITFIFKIQRLGALLNGRLYSVDKSKCTLCQLCLKNCPAGNIVLFKGHLRFDSRCQMCMRCSFFCPKNCISIGILDKWRVNGFYDFKALEQNKDLDGNFINGETKGIWKIYKKYFTAVR
jgi:flavoprotein